MESTTINDNINAIKEVRGLFNELKSNYSYEQRKKIREKLVIMSDKETNDIINELYDSFVRYQEGLETKMKGSSYTFERVDLLEYHLHK